MRALLAQSAFDLIGVAATNPVAMPVSNRGGDMAAALLLLLLAAMVILGAACLILILHFINPRRRDAGSDPRHEASVGPTVAWRNTGILLVPARWMAVRATTVREVRTALGLSNPVPCSIEDGLAGNHQQALFLAPPVNGWVLITGPGVPDPAEDIDEVYHLLRSLSIKLGAAQFFSFNRVIGHHGWAWARGGGIVRAFAWTGKTVWNEGDPTPAERAFRMRCPQYGDPPPQSASARENLLSNLDKVPLLAARWSVDPVGVHQQLPHGMGVAGEFSRVRSS